MTANRLQQLTQWVTQQLEAEPESWYTLAGDAGFRKYYRFHHKGQTLIAVDAPPEHEDNDAFYAVARALSKAGLHVPEIYQVDLKAGWFMLSDLGDVLYLDVLNSQSADKLYEKAFDALLKIQTCREFDNWTLPLYDTKTLRQECNLFSQWFLGQHCGLTLNEVEHQQLQTVFERLIQSASAQPQVCVHRDYHSRNLMVCPADRIGVIDFQGAVLGPITYDVVSLLRDCYIKWPEDKVDAWSRQFRARVTKAGLFPADLKEYWDQWFDWMGIQRHIKAIGIFARLHHRDNKSGYLQDIPRTLERVAAVSLRYSDLNWFYDFIISKVMPALEQVEVINE